MYTFFYFYCILYMYKIKGAYKIMEIKKALNLLTNQYFKSLKHLEHDYEKTSLYSERLKDFNEGYLKLMYTFFYFLCIICL